MIRHLSTPPALPEDLGLILRRGSQWPVSPVLDYTSCTLTYTQVKHPSPYILIKFRSLY